MKNGVFLLACIWLIFFCALWSADAKEVNLYAKLSKLPSVKVYINVTDSSQTKSVNPDDISTALKDALLKRKNINFKIVNSTGEADILIDADVRGYEWREKDPVDNLMGSAAIAIDVVMSENYARLTAYFVVRDTKTGDVLWERLLSGSATKKIMPEEESHPLVIAKLVKVFIRECFSQQRANKGSIIR